MYVADFLRFSSVFPRYRAVFLSYRAVFLSYRAVFLSYVGTIILHDSFSYVALLNNWKLIFEVPYPFFEIYSPRFDQYSAIFVVPRDTSYQGKFSKN